MAYQAAADGTLAGLPTSQVELSVSCRNLLDKDRFSKSDPKCVVYLRENHDHQRWIEIGRSETIDNNLNPDFVKKFVVDYFFEESQKLLFKIFDIDSKSTKMDDHDFLGQYECNLSEIVATGILKGKLSPVVVKVERFVIEKVSCQGGLAGEISIRSEEVSQCKLELQITVSAKNLDKKAFSKPSAFLEFRRTTEDHNSIVAYRTEDVKSNVNPVWKRFAISARLLCNGDLDRPLEVRCYDWHSNGNHQLLGQCIVTIRELLDQPNSVCCTLKHPDKARQQGNKYKGSGTIELQCRAEQVPSFLDYIHGGVEVQCTISIDFTQSNGDANNPSSLHYMDPLQPNQYATALRAVLEIVQHYDSDKLFPAVGFGAKVPPTHEVSHSFSLNFQPDPHCAGIDGVMSAYHHALRHVTFYGPTNFAPTINHVARFAHQHAHTGNVYHILVIITDGVISDMPQTTKAIVEASKLPMSIIIIGVGDADFSAMETLDGDDVRVNYNGVYAERDMVQFVPFNKFLSIRDVGMRQGRLAKEVLQEVPDQFLQWMRSHHIAPRPPHNNSMVGPYPQLPTIPQNAFVPFGHAGVMGGATVVSHTHINNPNSFEVPPPYSASTVA